MAVGNPAGEQDFTAMVDQSFHGGIIFTLVFRLDMKDLIAVLYVSVKTYYHKAIIKEN